MSEEINYVHDKVIDLLHEDSRVYGQQYACFSYLLPRPGVEGMTHTIFKIRGCFSNEEIAVRRRMKIMEEEPHIPVYIVPVGVYQRLLHEEELDAKRNDDPNVQMMNQDDRDMINGSLMFYRNEVDERKKQFQERLDEEKRKNEYMNTSEGQNDISIWNEKIEEIEDQMKELKIQKDMLTDRVKQIEEKGAWEIKPRQDDKPKESFVGESQTIVDGKEVTIPKPTVE